MRDEPKEGSTPLLVLVESARHPIDCVQAIYERASIAGLRTSRAVWLQRVLNAYQKLASTEISGWKLPQLQADWRTLRKALIEHIVENSDPGAIIMIDEFPLMIWNIADDHGANLAVQFLDALREIRQQFEPTERRGIDSCNSAATPRRSRDSEMHCHGTGRTGVHSGG